MQPSGTASFSQALANEMNDKGDAPETRPEEASTVPDTALNKVPKNPDITTEDVKDTVASDVKDLEIPENLENSKESKNPKALGDTAFNAAETQKKRETKISNDLSATTIATSPQPMSLADILHGLISAYSPNARPDDRTETRTETRTTASAETAETPTDARAVHTRADAQMEPATATDPQAGLTVIPVMLPGLAAVRPGKAESGTSAATTAITASDLTPQSPDVRAATATRPREKHAAGIQDIQNQKAIKLELDARQSASQQVEFSAPGISVAAQTGKSEKSLPELAPKDLPTDLQTPGLFNASAAPPGIAADRGIAPAAAGMPVYAGLSLEPRLGATGWDNALGQKVLWMVSQQQQVAELSLNPPDLGPLQVVLTINNDQASAMFVSPHADVRQALEAALPRLREMMAEGGISLGSATVNADTSQQQGGFERQDRSIPRHGENESGRAMAASNAQSTGIGMSRIRDGGSRLVDTFA